MCAYVCALGLRLCESLELTYYVHGRNCFHNYGGGLSRGLLMIVLSVSWVVSDQS